MRTSFLKKAELLKIGFNHVGENVSISRNTSIYYPELISIADNVRIDDFCILIGNITIGSFVHISAYSALYGKAGITVDDFVSISSRVNIYSVSDDYSGEYLTNPTVPEELTNIIAKPVHLHKHVIIGAGSIVLPGVTINEGAAVGALSLINKSLDPWKIYAGIPCKSIKNRKKDLLKHERKIKEN
jgi:acetyltransferase-like isoleucine patch superfamily enzyme